MRGESKMQKLFWAESTWGGKTSSREKGFWISNLLGEAKEGKRTGS